jgi:hypothetical protein
MYRRREEQTRVFIPVLFHNLRGFDSHLIIKKFESTFCYFVGQRRGRWGYFGERDRITVIGLNTEKFTSFDLLYLRFLDSLQFLGTSLESLVDNLKKIMCEWIRIILIYQATCRRWPPRFFPRVYCL